MCTATLIAKGSSLLLTFNRDELLVRGPEIAPTIHSNDKVSWISPLDSDGGGSWIAINNHGVALALLNGYSSTDSRPEKQQMASRGKIITSAIGQGDREDIHHWLNEKLDPSPYQSFTILLASANNAFRVNWDGIDSFTSEKLDPGWNCMSSSSWKTREVLEWRQQQFREWLDEGGTFNNFIPDFQLLHSKEAKERSPLMQRTYAETRSITQVEVNEVECVLRYWRNPLQGIDTRNPDSEKKLKRINR